MTTGEDPKAQTGDFGNSYTPERAAAEGAAQRRPHADMRPDAEGRDIAPGAGQRATFSGETGAVRGSGMGAGGGQAGEDYASDPETGDGYPVDGGERE